MLLSRATSDALRGWALYARPIAERIGDTAEFTLTNGATVRYTLGEGLTYSTPAGDVSYPEAALDDETFEVAS